MSLASHVTAVCAAVILSACSSAPKQEPARTYAMGEKVTVGHMVYTVIETRWLTQLPMQPTPRIPTNRFFLVRVSVVNGAGGDQILPDMTVEDDNGGSFPALTNGDGVPQWIGTLRKISPAESATGNVVFDVAPRHYKLRVSDENGDNTALIDIPFSFDSEAPSLPPLPNEAK
jgi:hypothetical protein